MATVLPSQLARKGAGSKQAGAALVRSSPEPLYRQLAERLQREIDAGVLAPGSKLESESALMARFGVSRVTVRQATALLQKHGKVQAQRGKGTFVLGRVVQHDLDALQGFYDALRSQGIEPQTRLLEFSPDAGALDEQRPQALDLPVRLQRLYSVDERAFALVIGYLPSAAAALGEKRAERLTVYQILQEYLGLRVARAEVTIRCQRPPRAIGRLLGLKIPEQALVMERTSFSQDQRPCEFMRIYIVPERYEFRLRVLGALELARSVHRVPPTLGPGAESRMKKGHDVRTAP